MGNLISTYAPRPLDYAPAWIRVPARRHLRLTQGIIVGLFISLTSTSLALWLQQRRRLKAVARVPPRPVELRSDEVVKGVTGLIGNTPLVRINSLSNALGVEILGKAEFLNPGGSVKDRVALKIIEDAEEQGLLHPNTGSCIFEGTVGSTGISIATIAASRGYKAHIIMPDDVATEKSELLEKLGATVEKVRPASIVDKKQFVNLAKQRALEFGRSFLPVGQDDLAVSSRATQAQVSHVQGASAADDEAVEQEPRGFFANQFEIDSNWRAHYEGTAPEIWRQSNGNVDVFISGAGTGGTLSGCATYLRQVSPGTEIVLADPEGSGLFNKVKYGVMFAPQEAEGRKRRHQVDTVVEGIGINRITRNFEQGEHLIDDAIKVTDEEAVSMSRHLVLHDGLFLGSSSACNLVAAVRIAKRLGKNSGKTIVTILCDSGARHLSKFWSDDYLQKAGIRIDPSIQHILDE